MVYNLNTTYIFLSTFLFFVILTALTSSSVRFVPYSAEPGYSMYREGMTLSPAPLVPEKTNDQVYTVPNFNGVYAAPGVSIMIDKLGSVKASKAEDCKTESNLSTSNGFLCLSNEIKQALSSRGGNA